MGRGGQAAPGTVSFQRANSFKTPLPVREGLGEGDSSDLIAARCSPLTLPSPQRERGLEISSEPAERVGGLVLAGDHFVGGRFAGHRAFDRVDGGLVVVVVDLL